ncbi:hypothetical protein CON64_10960 [Bacillus pseudomycoides]|nr:hypothetical protein CON64_10960 [Bacillus pseudomycoides]
MNPSTMLFQEEWKSAKLFLWMTNCALVLFHFFSKFYVLKLNNLKEIMLSASLCIIILCMLCIGIFYMKKGNPYAVKYVYLIGYSLGEFFNLTLMYMMHSAYIGIWGVLECMLTFFVPIFMSKRYFWILTTSFLIKYSVASIIFPKTSAFIFMGLFIILVSIFYILLVYFQSYIKAIHKLYKETKQKQQLAVMGKMAATVGHEIRNPLTSLKGFTQLQKEKYPHDLAYQNMLEEIEQMNEMISELMILGKPKSEQYSMYHVKQLLLDAIAAEEQQIFQQKIKINKCFPKEILHIECNEKQMHYAFVRSMKKVIEETKYGSCINIGTYMISENHILIYFADERYEISKKKMENNVAILGVEKASDFGLGLMAAYKIVNEHQGHVHVNHAIDGGAKVEIILPIKQED